MLLKRLQVPAVSQRSISNTIQEVYVELHPVCNYHHEYFLTFFYKLAPVVYLSGRALHAQARCPRWVTAILFTFSISLQNLLNSF